MVIKYSYINKERNKKMLININISIMIIYNNIMLILNIQTAMYNIR